ncbi:MAG: YncE family protein, partial [Gemmatimonadota bacterium]|nr:YncE family protein [Gemmatimonadota bacterium]
GALVASPGRIRSVECRPHDRVLRERADGADGSDGVKLAGRLMVANQFSNSATVVDLATGASVELDAGDGPHEAAASPDGKWGVVSNFGERDGRGYSGNRLFVVDLAGARLVEVINTGEYRGLHDIAFRPGYPTRALVTAQTSRRLLEVDVETGRIVGTVDTRGDRSHMLAVTRDGLWAFTTNEGTGTISRLHLPTHRFIAAFPASENVEGIAVTDDGRELWVGEPAIGAVTVRNAESGAVLATLSGFRYPVRIVAAPGGRMIISDPGCRTIVTADAATRRVVSAMKVDDDPPVVAGDVAPDGRIAFLSASDQGAVLAVDLDAGTIVGRYRAGRHPDGIAWAPPSLAPQPRNPHIRPSP